MAADQSKSKSKRLKTNQLALGLKPEFQFKEVPIDDQPQWTNRNETDKFSAHADSAHNVYVSDSSRIVCFSQDGSYRSVVSGVEPHHIVPNGSADYVVILRKSDKQKLCKVSADGSVSTILEMSTPLYGPDVCSNGDVVHHPSASRLERRSGNGELAASVEGGRGKVISFEANSYLTSGQDGHVYFCSKTCIYRWNNQERTVECIAGNPKASGRRDGFGADARFTHLKRPVMTLRFAYIRESDNRFCRVDLETFEVSTLRMRGVDPAAIETYGVTPDGQVMFLIFTAPFRIYTAQTSDTIESTFLSDLRRVDWMGEDGPRIHVELIAGKDRQVYRADGRILAARSAYFCSLLSGGMREASDAKPIDLGEDVCGESLCALLHFVCTDHFEPVTPQSRLADMRDAEVLKLARYALKVHTLADRFLLPRLARLCEVFLADHALRPSIALSILAIIAPPQRPSLANLESACWRLVEENWNEIVEHHSDALRDLVEQGHSLAVELLQASSGVKRSVARVEEAGSSAA